MELEKLTAHELAGMLRTRDVTCGDIIRAVFMSIEKQERTVNAYITLLKDQALNQADLLDVRIRAGGTVGALAGIPVAVKDNICVKAVKTTCASRILENFYPPYSATVVEKLQAADAVLIGKTNMDEFAMGSSTETSHWGPTTNPHDPTKVPGGSSGGSAAAVAAHEAILSLGSDTGGSIRQPAALCGVVGLKPTYGRVSRFGLVAYASSLDQIGPLGKDVLDTAMLLHVIAGHDERDSTSADVPVPDYPAMPLPSDAAISRLTFGVPQEYFTSDMHPEVSRCLEAVITRLEKCGAKKQEISLPHTHYAIPTYYVVASAEASSNLARYDGVKYGFRAGTGRDLEDMYVATRTLGFGREVKRRIMLGTYTLSSGYYDAYYVRALKVRTLIRHDFTAAFRQCDFILTPTTPSTAFSKGEKINDPIQMYLSDIYTISCNLAGIPGLSLPCGKDRFGLPIGLQICGKPFSEQALLQCAYWLEQNVLQY